MTYVETRISVWEALAGRAPGEPLGPADPGLWGAVVERLNPAKARPVLRTGVEWVELTSVRGSTYVMLRSPDDGGRACYLRLTPQEWQLALMMDGTYTVARLVAEFARLSGRLAPDQVRRIVADLAGNRMLDELPVDAFGPLRNIQRKPLPQRIGSGLLAAARGRRMLVVDIDGVVSGLYRFGGRFLFTKFAAALLSVVAVLGLGVFVATWFRGSQALFLSHGSYLLGALVLLLLNVFALACHELGHALAAKHAGREVPAAGLLVYFGIPSVFVDTTDVWMAGRRARLLVTAAGPLTGVVLAGSMQLVALAIPAVGPLAFKLSFAWYLNGLFNLNPFIALDGYYLLMDWLEIPNLRTRGIAWVTGRLRRRPPAWAGLDVEGKIVALYGVLAVLWLAIAANLAYRIWADRVSGLVTGLWHNGVAGQLLLVLILGGLCAPLIYLLAGRLARWWRRYRERSAERAREADSPRRVAALRASDLGGLPEPALAGLAARAHWLRPSSGRQLVFAGGAQQDVYVVVDGAMEARQDGDPGGTIRHHVGPGGVVGLASALTGRPTRLNWHTAGTTLLAVPAATVASVIGPLPGPPPRDRDEAETLFADTPALAELPVDARLALIAGAHPVDLEPGAPVVLPGPTQAVVVESGVIATPDGVELRRGTLVGPVGEGDPGEVAQTRTPARLWVIPDASNLPPLVGAAGHVAGSPQPSGRAITAAGLHGAGVYPPLAAPPGPPDGTEDPEVDRRFARRMWWLVLLLLLLAMMLTVANFVPGPVWAEMATDKVLLTADRGPVTVGGGGGTTTRLEQGDRRYLGEGSWIEVPARSTGRLTFSGGSTVLLCAGSRTDVGVLWTGTGRQRSPHGTLGVDAGRLLADTTSTSGAYHPLSLLLRRPAGDVRNTGEAWYAVDPGAVTVSIGSVAVAGTPVPATSNDLTCGDGVVIQPPATQPPSQPPSEEPSPTEVTPSVSVAPPTVNVPTTIPQPRRNPRPNPRTTPPPTTTRPPTTTPTPTTRPPTTTPSSPSTSPSPSTSTSPSRSTSPSPSATSSSPPIIIG
ncbi:cyclic nucleotide-binding protein [Actinoplanes sp. KI2]|uniref:cyclic nucleotide-binding protein n=1 Tax=Actinoplanes sp. KI2 TaxID=2983315 RepID=UPI0021D613C8|nr:cyclic nucleotide-binding protein [Actinoplanes sp. KI2]MCU7725199.1 cyclic nucleotide-binding protein [Actinoplanes sp. KI2]